MAAGAGAINALASIMTGNDIEGRGAVSAGDALNVPGARFDLLNYWAGTRDGTPSTYADQDFLTKAGATLKWWGRHAADSVTHLDGAKRTYGPMAVGIAAKTAVKIVKPNKYVPKSVRRYVRF